MTILVTGGAGYIGSHMVKALRQAGIPALVLDNLSYGHETAVGQTPLIKGNVGDAALLDHIFTEHAVSAVMHFASYIQVAESIAQPEKYFENNVTQTLTLLDAMQRHGVDNFIFSSSAAVYGAPRTSPMDEAHPQSPINPYGWSKLKVEEALAERALRYISLRYFNAAGADPEGELGECHEPETHLIPLVLQAASGRRAHVTLYGTDYDTPDGSCIRDYIHVCDLAQAHLLALRYLQQGGESGCFNLGTGRGYSVLEVITAAEKVTGKIIAVQQQGRRAGDAPVLVANGTRAQTVLGWHPRFSDLETILRHAWAWEQKLQVASRQLQVKHCHPGLVPGSQALAHASLTGTTVFTVPEIPAQGRDDTKNVTYKKHEQGWAVMLNGKPAYTPQLRALVLPGEALAAALAIEFRAQKTKPNPLTMPCTQLACIALDIVADKRVEVIAELKTYAETDLVCHRAEADSPLHAEQEAAFAPLLAWAQEKFAAVLTVTEGIMPATQSPKSIKALARHMANYNDFEMAALSVLVKATGSLILGLAVMEKKVNAEEAALLSQLEERYSLKHWGDDPALRNKLEALAQDIRHAEEFLLLTK